MILATGHLSPEESIILIKRARQKHVEKIVVTHPEFPNTKFTLEQQKDLIKYGVYFERCYYTIASKKIDLEYVVSEIKATGPERNILSSDLGPADTIEPVKGYEAFVDLLISNGISEDNIPVMVRENQEKLIFK
jgi:predicted metal-dependent TIM-barrel fold hydrolase